MSTRSARALRHLRQPQRRPPIRGELEGERASGSHANAAWGGALRSARAGGTKGCSRKRGGPGGQLSRRAQGAGLTRAVEAHGGFAAISSADIGAGSASPAIDSASRSH
eukprot:6323536-Prymnesium_polylepis.1